MSKKLMLVLAINNIVLGWAVVSLNGRVADMIAVTIRNFNLLAQSVNTQVGEIQYQIMIMLSSLR